MIYLIIMSISVQIKFGKTNFFLTCIRNTRSLIDYFNDGTIYQRCHYGEFA